jgi:exosortase/archaeosortase family protein
MSIRMGDMWRSLPPGASTFLKRAALLFAAWKLLYILVLLPMREPDGWLVSSVGESTAGTLNLFKGDGHYRVRHEYAPHRPAGRAVVSKSYVYREGRRPDIGIAAPCNGLELMVLAVGFILCFEAGWRRKAIYVSASLVGVYAVNVARCSLLTVIKTEHPVYFVFAHKYLFNIAGYGFVFLIWMWYVQGLMPKPAVAASGSGVR